MSCKCNSDNWIRTKHDLPPFGKRVLVSSKEHGVHFGERTQEDKEGPLWKLQLWVYQIYSHYGPHQVHCRDVSFWAEVPEPC